MLVFSGKEIKRFSKRCCMSSGSTSSDLKRALSAVGRDLGGSNACVFCAGRYRVARRLRTGPTCAHIPKSSHGDGTSRSDTGERHLYADETAARTDTRLYEDRRGVVWISFLKTERREVGFSWSEDWTEVIDNTPIYKYFEDLPQFG